MDVDEQHLLRRRFLECRAHARAAKTAMREQREKSRMLVKAVATKLVEKEEQVQKVRMVWEGCHDFKVI